VTDLPQKIDIDNELLIKVGKIADEAGFEVYVVGGYVRDFFLGRHRSDFDITVVGDPLNFAKVLEKKFNSKIVIFENFRTAMIPVDGQLIEVVGTRKEEYLPDSRKPVVSEGKLYDDIARRDFTVNTLAASLNIAKFGEVVDYFNGLADLESKVLKTPLDPHTTYSDDPLRMMRAARFASQLNFELVAESIQAIKEMRSRIAIISQERISAEFLKILQSEKPSVGLMILKETGLMEIIFPEFDALSGVDIRETEGQVYGHKDVFLHTLKVVDNISVYTDNVWLRFAALMHDIAKPRTKKYIKGIGWTFHGHEEIGARMQKKIFHRMKLPVDALKYVEKLVRLHQRPMVLAGDDVSDSAIRRLAANAGEHLEDLLILCKADITTKNANKSEKYFKNYEDVFRRVLEVQEKDKLREFQSPVKGEEIMQICQLQPSRLVGFLKSKIEDAILEGFIPNEYFNSKAYFLENKDTWIEEFRINPNWRSTHQ